MARNNLTEDLAMKKISS
jgi:dephospho-CoA kinase